MSPAEGEFPEGASRQSDDSQEEGVKVSLTDGTTKTHGYLLVWTASGPNSADVQ